MVTPRELALTYVQLAQQSSAWLRYCQALLSANTWNTSRHLAVLDLLRTHGNWKYLEENHLTKGLIRGPTMFFKAIRKARANWEDLEKYIEKGDRDSIVKLRVGLGMKGASVLLRDSGFQYMPLDVHVLRSSFSMDRPFITHVQSKRDLYIDYENRFMEQNKGNPALEDLRLWIERSGADLDIIQGLWDFPEVRE